MTHHILREDALCRAFIMCAAGGVDVMIPRIPAKVSGINPALESKRDSLRLVCDLDCLRFDEILGPARELYCIFPNGKFYWLAICPVDLRVKRKIRRQTFRLRRVHVLLRVPDYE